MTIGLMWLETDPKKTLYDPAHVKPARYILPNHYWVGSENDTLLTR